MHVYVYVYIFMFTLHLDVMECFLKVLNLHLGEVQ